MLLAGDIGGTKTVLALFRNNDGGLDPIAEASFPSRKYRSLEEIIEEFMTGVEGPVSRASFGVAGPVVDGRAEVTNLPWSVASSTISYGLDGAPVDLLNDLAAVAAFVPFLESSDLATLNRGRRIEHGVTGVVAPGTGLGEAFLVWNGGGYEAFPSEGGHCSFAPATEREIELLRYLQAKLGHVSVERVCSGSGIPNIYACFRDAGVADEPAWLVDRLAAADDPTPVIVGAAIDRDRPCELCVATLDTFMSVLGGEAGNLALKVLATGGIYLGGGIPRRLVPQLQAGPFVRAFTNKGRFSEFLAGVDVRVICNPRSALLGAARYGMQRHR